MDKTAYEVSFPSRGWFDLEPGLINAMNTPGSGSRMRLPVSPWPAAFSSGNGEYGTPTFTGEEAGWLGHIVGETFKPEPAFSLPLHSGGWTAEKVADYVESREGAQVVVDGQISPTLAFLAWYFGTSVVVSQRHEDGWMLYLISGLGEVTPARYTGDQEGFGRFRYTYLQRSPEEGIALPGVEVLASLPADPLPWEHRADTCRSQLADWKRRHADGSLPAPDGAVLAAGDLELTPVGSGEVLARADVEDHRYELLYPQDGDPESLEVLCTVDGERRRFLNLVTGVAEGMAAPAADWAQRILKDSAAKAKESTPKLWETNEPDADLFRIVNNIVRYDEHEAATSHFRTSDELQEWLKEALGHHNAPLFVRTLEDVRMVLRHDSKELPMFQNNTFERAAGPEPTTTYAPRPFNPWKGLENWLNGATGMYSRHPLIQTVMDGQELESYAARNCLDYEYVTNELLPGDAEVGPNSWFILGIRHGLYPRTCIAFPAAESMLSVVTDNDGASAMITARDYDSRNIELHREADFEDRWSAWLDEDHQLTKDEIQAGLAKVEELIEEHTP